MPIFPSTFLSPANLSRILHLLFQKSRAGFLLPKPRCKTFLNPTVKWCQASCEGKPAICSGRSTRTGFWVTNVLSTNNLTSLKAVTSVRYERRSLPKHDSPAVQSAAEVEASQPVEQKGTDRNICLLLEQKALPRPPLL